MRVGRRLERLQFLSRVARATPGVEPAGAAHARGVAAGGVRQPHRLSLALHRRAAPRADARSAHPRQSSIRARWRFTARRSRAISRASARRLAAQSVETFDGHVPSLDDAELFALENEGTEAAARRAAAGGEHCRALAAAASQLSDRLSMRHFSHTGADAARASLPEARMRYRVRASRRSTRTEVTWCTPISFCIWCRGRRRFSNASSIRIDDLAGEFQRGVTRPMRSAISSRAWSSSTRIGSSTSPRRWKWMFTRVRPSRRPTRCRGNRCATALRTQVAWPAREVLEACRFRHESPYVRVKQVFTDYGDECFPPGRPILACAEALMQKLHRELTLCAGRDEHRHTADGSAAEPPWRMPGLRASDDCVPALAGPRRTVRERLHPPAAARRPSRSASERHSARVPWVAPNRVRAADWVGAGASHAWVSVYSPPFGWLELDPTNNVHVGTDHVAVAWGRDFGDVSPLRGVILGGGTHDLSVRVTVEPLAEDAVMQ